MNEDRSLLIGFDLGKEYTQISYFNSKNFEPESICTEDEEYLIPTCLGVRTDTKEWVFGSEVEKYSQLKKVIELHNLLEYVVKNRTTEIMGATFNGTELLEKFFRKCLNIVKKYYPSKTIKKMVVTIETLNSELVQSIYKALEGLGIMKDRVCIYSYSQSYIYYALCQNRELWQNDIGLFDYNDEGLVYYQIHINRKQSPYTVGIAKRDFRETLSYDMLTEIDDTENLCYIFHNIAESVLHKQIVSTLYMTGSGFETDWADSVFEKLCIGRRVFKGQNLYTKGACYGARELTEDKRLQDFQLLTEDMIAKDIIIKAYCNAKINEVVILGASTVWYEADNCIDLILDGENEIEIITVDVITRDKKSQIISLDGMPVRPERMTRVRLRARYLDKDSCVITIKDKGFGSYYETSNRIWEKVL